MIRFACSNCTRLISVDEKHSGKKGKCPKCGGVVVVPESSTIIELTCGSCGHKIRIPAKYAGKKGACPKCKNPIVVPSPEKPPSEAAETFSTACSMCDKTIRVPETSKGQTIDCPECGSYIEASSGGALSGSDASVPPHSDEDLYQEETEECEGPDGVDRRIIVGIFAVAAVVIVGLIILAVVLRSSGSRPAERAGGLQGQQQVADTDLRPQQVTFDNALSDVFTWAYIKIDIEIQENGDLLISEQQECSFKAGPNEKRHELSRLLLMDRIDDIQDVEVYERTGSDETSSEPLALTHRIERDQNDVRICWSHELNPPETRTFLLEYRVIGGLRVGKPTSVLRRRSGGARNESVDELYWNAVTRPRSAVVEKAKVTVHLPSKLRGKERRAGSYGAIAAIKPDTDPDTIEFNRIRAIPPGTGLQIYVAFQHGILKIKTTNGQRWRVLWQEWWEVLLCVLVATFLAIMLIRSLATGNWGFWHPDPLGHWGGDYVK